MVFVNCVVIGDIGIGKTNLLQRFATSSLPKSYIPTIFEHFSANLLIEDEEVVLNLIETSGNSAYDHLRALSYEHADIFLFCFSLISPASLQRIKSKWYPLIHRYCPNIPIVLVGTKSDLRKNREWKKNFNSKNGNLSMPTITLDQGKQAAEAVRAAKYFECSALTFEGVLDLFKEVAEMAVLRS